MKTGRLALVVLGVVITLIGFDPISETVGLSMLAAGLGFEKLKR